ncbi:hypothetical protein [Streptomyces fagopyri]|uniref:hypothetical protein n=1 Tax=Streptomyces fagopyri TaxID=2662397 RepID=UPI0033D53498
MALSGLRRGRSRRRYQVGARRRAAPWRLYANIAVSSPAAIGVTVASASGVAVVLRVWGTWAVASALIQLLVGVVRRPLGCQWAMIVSGGISVLAGATFIRSTSQDAPQATLAGYTTLGGIFFLVSAFRLSRSTHWR